MPTLLELYLVRHAVAEERGPDYPDDASRPLTPVGLAKWRRAAAGLKAHGVSMEIVLTSPFLRARETAEVLAASLKPRPRLVVVESLAAGTRLADMTAVIDSYATKSGGPTRIGLVGHEPDLGELAAALLGATGGITFKKGAVCRIDVQRARRRGSGVLHWLLPPRVLRNLAP